MRRASRIYSGTRVNVREGWVGTISDTLTSHHNSSMTQDRFCARLQSARRFDRWSELIDFWASKGTQVPEVKNIPSVSIWASTPSSRSPRRSLLRTPFSSSIRSPTSRAAHDQEWRRVSAAAVQRICQPDVRSYDSQIGLAGMPMPISFGIAKHHFENLCETRKPAALVS
jgi:hypothetical protein